MTLDLSSNQLLKVPTSALNPLILPSLVSLDLSDNYIMEISEEDFSGRAFEQLRELRLNGLREFGIEILFLYAYTNLLNDMFYSSRNGEMNRTRVQFCASTYVYLEYFLIHAFTFPESRFVFTDISTASRHLGHC